MKLVRSTLAVAAACVASLSAAQYALEIIPLRHRTVEQVLPTLRPLVEPGGTLTGQGNQLIVRASPANLADIRRALDAIDRPLRRLQISVRFDDALEASSRGIEASGRISNRGSRVGVQAQQSSSRLDERVDQRVQVLEGGRAALFSVQSMQQDLATGFEVVPRLSGNNVFLEIAPQRETVESNQRAATSVSGRLGEWFELGAAGSSATREDRGIASASGARAAQSRRIWVKVEEVRN